MTFLFNSLCKQKIDISIDFFCHTVTGWASQSKIKRRCVVRILGGGRLALPVWTSTILCGVVGYWTTPHTQAVISNLNLGPCCHRLKAENNNYFPASIAYWLAWQRWVGVLILSVRKASRGLPPVDLARAQVSCPLWNNSYQKYLRTFGSLNDFFIFHTFELKKERPWIVLKIDYVK